MSMKRIKPTAKDIETYKKLYGLDLKEIVMSDDEYFDLYIKRYLSHPSEVRKD